MFNNIKLDPQTFQSIYIIYSELMGAEIDTGKIFRKSQEETDKKKGNFKGQEKDSKGKSTELINEGLFEFFL